MFGVPFRRLERNFQCVGSAELMAAANRSIAWRKPPAPLSGVFHPLSPYCALPDRIGFAKADDRAVLAGGIVEGVTVDLLQYPLGQLAQLGKGREVRH